MTENENDHSQIEVLGICKKFGLRTILRDISFNANSEIVALKGSNGAGKTTLLNILAGAIEPDLGTVRICGFDLRGQALQARRMLSFVPADPIAYPFLTGAEFMRFVFSAKKVEIDADAEEVLARFELNDHLQTSFDKMSLGTRRKFYLAVAIIAKPRVLIMDEPTNAIDARSLEFLKEVMRMSDDQSTILYASHNESFIRETRSRVLALEQGQIRDVANS